MIKSYLITDASFYTSDPQKCLEMLLRIQEKYQPDYICLRDKANSDYKALASHIAHSSLKDTATKLYLHTDYALASFLGCDGVHLPSHAVSCIAKAKRMGLEVIISTHTFEEALKAEEEGADAITFSPIFHSPGKGEPLGLEKLKEINDKIRVKCFALGGIINTEQVKACEAVGVYGFASIRFFVD